MTGTTEQAPESGVKAPTAGTSSANGAADAHRPPQAEQPVGDLDGIVADALDLSRNGASLPKPRSRCLLYTSRCV